MRLQLEQYDEQQQDNDDEPRQQDFSNDTTTSSLERLQSTFICSVALNEDVLKHRTVKSQAIEAMRQYNIDISEHYPKTLKQALDDLIFLPRQQHASKPIDKLIVLCSCGDNVRAKLEQLSKQVCVWNIDAPSKISAKCGDSDAYQRVSLQIRDRIYELMEQSVFCNDDGVCEGDRCCRVDNKTGTVGNCDDY